MAFGEARVAGACGRRGAGRETLRGHFRRDDAGRHRQHPLNEHHDLAPARKQGVRQAAVFVHVCRDFENAKNTQQPQHAHVDQRMGAGQQ